MSWLDFKTLHVPPYPLLTLFANLVQSSAFIWRHLLRNLAQSFLSFGVESAQAALECLQVLLDCFGGDGVRTVAAVTIIIESSLVDLDRSQDLGLDVAQLQATAPDLLGGRDWNEVEVWRCS